MLSRSPLLPHHPCVPRRRGAWGGLTAIPPPVQAPSAQPLLRFPHSALLSSAGTGGHLPCPWPPSVRDSSHTCAVPQARTPGSPSQSSPVKSLPLMGTLPGAGSSGTGREPKTIGCGGSPRPSAAGGCWEHRKHTDHSPNPNPVAWLLHGHFCWKYGASRLSVSLRVGDPRHTAASHQPFLPAPSHPQIRTPTVRHLWTATHIVSFHLQNSPMREEIQVQRG